MPIVLPPGLPAAARLRAEGIAVTEAATAPSGALRIGLVNLMPDKVTTETQFARLLGATPETVSLTLLAPEGTAARRTPAEHLAAFYADIAAAPSLGLDGIIITGAPVETLGFEDVRYWAELTALYDHAADAGLPTLSVCWAAMAALHHFHAVPKHLLARKAFGVFAQTVHRPDAALMQGLGPSFSVPVSRHAMLRAADLAGTGAVLLAGSAVTGASVVADEALAQTMLLDHLEYDGDTLIAEFLRDRAAARPAAAPVGLAPGAAAHPQWRQAGHLLFRNWLAQVSRARAARQPRDLLAWLLAGPPPAGSGPELVMRTERAVSLPAAVISAAEGCGVAVAALVHEPQLQALSVRLAEGAAPAALERLAARCLAMPGVREVLLRGPGAQGAALRTAA